MIRKIHFIIPVLFLGIISCEKERFLPDTSAKLVFSVDTVYFDTVFTRISTVTKKFTVHNKYKDNINIPLIRLGGAENSVFRVNVDGNTGVQFKNVDIPPGDSIFVFVEATLNPNNSDSILLQEDSLQFFLNGRNQSVILAAWGQDVHLLRQKHISDQTWINDKPYLILDFLYVDSLSILTIEPGVRVYLHRDAVFLVGGTLVSNGSIDSSVYFRGDRLEKEYESIPGQWGGIYFLPGSKDNVLNYTSIRGGNFGVLVDTFLNAGVPVVTITNSFIADHSSFGLLARGSIVLAANSVFANCGTSAIALIWGGSYEFYHCTIANRRLYGNTRNTPAVFINNYYIDIYKNVRIRDIQKAYFGNCIIYGNRQYEFEIDKDPDNNGMLEYTIDHCIGKFSSPGLNANHILNSVNNQDPKFISWDEYNFELDTLSPAKDIGNVLTGMLFPYDKNGKNRMDDGKPDAGAFERIEE